MRHHAALMLICALVAAAAVVGAPAPRPRSIPWVTGWDKSVGDPRFEREGDKLTVTIGGVGGLSHARIMRDVNGDLAMQVRVRIPPDTGVHWEAAGLLLVDGEQYVYLARAARLVNLKFVWAVSLVTEERDQKTGRGGYNEKNVPRPASKPFYLRLERRGDRVRAMLSEDGKVWTEPDAETALNLPHKLKVGVFTRTGGAAEFKATFDDFKLTPLGGKTR